MKGKTMVTSINLQIIEGSSISDNELRKFISLLESQGISPEDKIAGFIRSFIKDATKPQAEKEGEG